MPGMEHMKTAGAHLNPAFLHDMTQGGSGDASKNTPQNMVIFHTRIKLFLLWIILFSWTVGTLQCIYCALFLDGAVLSVPKHGCSGWGWHRGWECANVHGWGRGVQTVRGWGIWCQPEEQGHFQQCHTQGTQLLQNRYLFYDIVLYGQWVFLNSLVWSRLVWSIDTLFYRWIWGCYRHSEPCHWAHQAVCDWTHGN